MTGRSRRPDRDRDGPAAEPGDRALRRHIAMLMRVGLLLASGLLVSSVVLRGFGAAGVATGMTVAGCAALILLPVLRLLLMLGHFGRRSDRLYVAITAVVIVLVAAAAVIGRLT